MWLSSNVAFEQVNLFRGLTLKSKLSPVRMCALWSHCVVHVWFKVAYGISIFWEHKVNTRQTIVSAHTQWILTSSYRKNAKNTGNKRTVCKYEKTCQHGACNSHCVRKKLTNFSSQRMVHKRYVDSAARVCSPIYRYTHLVYKPFTNKTQMV